MTSPRSRPAGSLQGLERWLTEWSAKEGLTAGRLRRRVGVLAVAAMLDTCRDATGEHVFQVKGGSSPTPRTSSPRPWLPVGLDSPAK